MTVVVHRVGAREAPILAQSWAEAQKEMGDRGAPADMDRVKTHAGRTPGLFESWVALDRNGAGACVGHAIATTGYDVDRAVATIQLQQLYVAPEQRRGGVARLLISAVCVRAMEMGAREIMITTGVDNTVARRFFAAIGAEERQMSVYMLERDSIEWVAAETA